MTFLGIRTRVDDTVIIPYEQGDAEGRQVLSLFFFRGQVRHNRKSYFEKVTDCGFSHVFHKNEFCSVTVQGNGFTMASPFSARPLATVSATNGFTRSNGSNQAVPSVTLVFDFPAIINTTVTCDPTFRLFNRREAMDLCNPSPTRLRYAELCKKTGPEMVFPSSTVFAFDRAQFAKFAQYMTSRDRTKSQQFPIALETMFGAGLHRLYTALERVQRLWTERPELRKTACYCWFYHDGRVLLRPVLPDADEPSITLSNTRPMERGLSTGPDDYNDGDDDHETGDDDEDDDGMSVEEHGIRRSAYPATATWAKFLQPLSGTAPKQTLDLVATFVNTSAEPVDHTGRFLPVDLFCEHLRMNAHQVCDALTQLGYYPWYFNAASRSELSIFGWGSRSVLFNSKLPEFQLDKAAFQRVKTLLDQRPQEVALPRSSSATSLSSIESKESTLSSSSSSTRTSPATDRENSLDSMDFDMSQLTQQLLQPKRGAVRAGSKRVLDESTVAFPPNKRVNV